MGVRDGEWCVSDVLLGNVCGECLVRLDSPMVLDGGVVGVSWREIVRAHMESHARWVSRMQELARDICGEGRVSDD